MTLRGTPVGVSASAPERSTSSTVSAKTGFVLRESGGKAIRVTSSTFVGTAPRVPLTAGRWTLLLGSGKASTFVVT